MVSRRATTMRDVAIRAGVSTATVSNVLGNRKAVDPELARRVRQVAAELDYQIDRAASQLRTGRAAVVAIVVPSLDNPFFTGFIAAVERAVQGEGYDIIVSSSNGDEAQERARIAAMLSWRPSGLIVVPCTDAFPARDLTDFSGAPVVAVDRIAGADAISHVSVNNRAAARMAADHLIGFGHRHLLVCASSLQLANIRERCEGVQQALAEAGLPAPSIVEVGQTLEVVPTILAPHLSSAEDRATGIIALTSTATLGVLSAARDLGLAVPDDVSLVGFDDYAWMTASTPPITAVRQPLDMLGRAAWDLLKRRMASPGGAAERLVFSCRLEVRRSTRSIGPPLVKCIIG
ncbi:MAG: LacI family DNA-binding transcriptional regulator [Ancalomicrobiaceae bacterium]|nr:LacI family DNA-binding transcriptional regulator [Ancalomicrobiaceae bacterium]